MANYLSLEEAAAKLGIPTDRLVELRSQGQVRGFRDGASWKFPDNEIDRLADDLGDSAGGSDVNLVASGGNGSDVALVAGKTPQDADPGKESGSDIEPARAKNRNLVEIDSVDLELDEPAITHDSAHLDLAAEIQSGSTGPITDEELREIADSDPDALADEPNQEGRDPAEDSGEYRLQGDPKPGPDPGTLSLDSDDDLRLDGGEASSLEMMSDLDTPRSESGIGSSSSAGDVLSELDLLNAEQEGSGLISGDSENLLASAGSDIAVGSGLGSGSGLEDALDDDDLVIADDDDDLVLGGAGSDISVAGDSGINLMSPSDSGLSLESEPLDLAGSSISALDLGTEAGSGSSGTGGSGPGSSRKRQGGSSKGGSGVSFEGDEEFQLSPSGIGIDADDSGSQVIEIEDSEAVAEPVEFGEAGFDEEGGFAADDAGGLEEDGSLGIDAGAAPMTAGARGYAAYEVPFSKLQVVALAIILCVMSLGGMLMTDLVRNMWAYAEPSAPVSSLTNALIELVGWGK